MLTVILLYGITYIYSCGRCSEYHPTCILLDITYNIVCIGIGDWVKIVLCVTYIRLENSNQSNDGFLYAFLLPAAILSLILYAIEENIIDRIV